MCLVAPRSNTGTAQSYGCAVPYVGLQLELSHQTLQLLGIAVQLRGCSGTNLIDLHGLDHIADLFGGTGGAFGLHWCCISRCCLFLEHTWLWLTVTTDPD